MNDTSDHTSHTSSQQGDPQSFSESKSQARLSSEKLQKRLEANLMGRLNGLGSTIYKTVWKQHTTPSGYQISRLRASALRTSGSGHSSERSGWITPGASDGTGGGQLKRVGGPHSQQLNDQVMTTGWSSPTVGNATGSQMAKDASPTGRRSDGSKATVSLNAVSKLSGWTTPQAHDTSGRSAGQKEIHGTKHGCACLVRDAEKTGWPTPQAGNAGSPTHSPAGNTDFSRKTEALVGKDVAGHNIPDLTAWDQNGPARITGDGAMLTGSSAGMENGGQLNPAHSRWLMGYPPEWDDCAVTAMPSSRKQRRSS